MLILLKKLINKNILPLIYEHGGVGASGDLVQLAHIALALIGEGEVYYNDKIEKLEVRALANNFAIKEAFSKSLGLGFRDPCYPNSISVNRDDLGKPFVIPRSKLKKYLIEKYGNFVIHVSLSDTKKYSIASVILEQT